MIQKELCSHFRQTRQREVSGSPQIMVVDVGDLDGFQQRGGCSPRLILSLIHQHLLYLACLGKKEKSVRLFGMSCASWLCILPVRANKVSYLLECHVHHGSVSCLFVPKKYQTYVHHGSVSSCLFVHTKKCQTFWNVMYIIALYLACLGRKKVSDFLECHVHHSSVSCLFGHKKVSDFLECHVHHSSVSCLFGEEKSVRLSGMSCTS